ncbi:ABC transporter ATP-binding protein, partial [Arachidicoccus sp.]|uniref:ABC transporter ATP-binding protein n=1 Tax=Arachidicoccus sp. TaxID=1872624 RepID=UPI003D1BFEE8
PIRPYLIQLTIDRAIGKTGPIPQWLHVFISGNNLNDVTRFIVTVTVFQIVFILIETLTRFIFTFLTSWLGQAVVKDLRVNVFRKISYFNLRQFDHTPIGTLTTRTINDIESINDIFSDGFIPIIADLLSIIFTLATMFFLNWKLTLISLIPFPILILATYYFKESVNKSYKRVRNAIAALNAFVQEHISGMAIVQAFSAEDREREKFDQINKQHRDANISAIFAYSVFFPVVEIILSLSLGILIWYIADRKIEAGLLVSFILYLNQIFRPLRVIADKFNVLQMGMIAAERVFTVLENEDNLPPSLSNAYNPSKVAGRVNFNKVSFAYTPPHYVLKNINFQIREGETVAIVGHTGSGKTSIISLLNRLYEIQEGEIMIDDVNIKSYNIETLRRNIGVVLQDVFLFSGSVLDNITLRNINTTEAHVIEAAKMIGAHDFIMQLPGGYHFNVMERGNSLSLGQRQLISFIRALLYNPSILILDEATSSIDTESEMLVQKAIDKLISGRTSIVIAHRLSTIRKAHKIIVLDNGEIKEIGSHAQLLKQKGFYAKLHQMQFAEEQTSA